MKFSLTAAAVLSSIPYLVQGLVVREYTAAIEVAGITPSVPFASVNLNSKRADDDYEWQMVIYNNGSEGDQCGGVANDFSGTSNFCEGLKNTAGKLCADVKVGANLGFAKCDFSFRADGTSCGGDERQKVTVDKGSDSNGVKLSDDVKFVSIICSK